MTHTKDNIALVEVPEGAKGLRTEMNGRWLSFYVMTGEKKAFPEQRDTLLPPGCWRFVCLSTEMTEEKAREVVEAPKQSSTTYYSKPADMRNVERIVHDNPVNGCKVTWRRIDRIYFKDYARKQPRRAFGWVGEVDTALASFASLLTSLGCDPAGTYAVLINTTP